MIWFGWQTSGQPISFKYFKKLEKSNFFLSRSWCSHLSLSVSMKNLFVKLNLRKKMFYFSASDNKTFIWSYWCSDVPCDKFILERCSLGIKRSVSYHLGFVTGKKKLLKKFFLYKKNHSSIIITNVGTPLEFEVGFISDTGAIIGEENQKVVFLLSMGKTGKRCLHYL